MSQPQPLYRVVLTGELIPGHTVEGAAQGLARIFHASPDSLRYLFRGGSHPIKKSFTADKAIELQERLERLGVRSRVEKMPSRPLDLELRDEGPEQGGISSVERSEWVRCQACGREQPDADECLACGAPLHDEAPAAPPVFEREAPLHSDRPRPHAPAPARGHAQNQWFAELNEFEDDRGPNEDERLGLFIGPNSAKYMQAYGRFRGPRGFRFAPTWNWPAFIAPFLWALARKLWLPATGFYLIGVLAPMVLIMLGIALGGGGGPGWASVLPKIGYAMVAVSMVTGGLVGNYLYHRHTLANMRRFAGPGRLYNTEMELSMAGGVNPSAPVVGAVISGVLGLFIWSVIDTVTTKPPPERPVAGINEDGSLVQETVVGTSDAVKQEGEDNKWQETRRRLRALGQKINEALILQGGAANPGQVTLFKLRAQDKVTEDDLVDAWGSELQYVPETAGYRILSAGPDRLYGTTDDLQYRRVLE